MHLKIFCRAVTRETAQLRRFSQVRAYFRNLDGMNFQYYSNGRSMKKVSDYFTGRIARGDSEAGVGFCSSVLGGWQLSENDKKAT